MTETLKTTAEFIAEHQITMTATRTDSNPNMADSRDMDHWICKFERRELTGKRYNARKDGSAVVARMQAHFSMGYGHKGAEPTAKDVLDCLASDASSIEWDTFEAWADNMGYDSDSRKAERIYKAVERGSAKLKRFLGDALYDALLHNTERE